MTREVFDEPELAGYVPIEGMPRARRRRRLARGVILVGIGALVLPTVFGTWAVARSSAASSCADFDRIQDRSEPSQARFDLFGPGGPGWYCAADGADLAGLGLIPYGGLTATR